MSIAVALLRGRCRSVDHGWRCGQGQYRENRQHTGDGDLTTRQRSARISICSITPIEGNVSSSPTMTPEVQPRSTRNCSRPTRKSLCRLPCRVQSQVAGLAHDCQRSEVCAVYQARSRTAFERQEQFLSARRRSSAKQACCSINRFRDQGSDRAQSKLVK